MSKIILVEDDDTMRSLLVTLLEYEGFQVIPFNTAGDVLEILRREKPDALLMDVHLRETNGLDVLRQIRQDRELAQTKVLMSSGMDKRMGAIEAGADDFILKPYMPDELVFRVKRLVAKE
jgi:DNA-binding response OmpR family regulator